MRVLVSGGTGALSTRVTREAPERGHGVLAEASGRRLLASGHAVRVMRADREAPREPACEHCRFAPDVGASICFDPARGEGWVALFGAAPRAVRINSVAAG